MTYSIMFSRNSLLTILFISTIQFSCDLKIQEAAKTIVNAPPIQLTSSPWSKSDPAWSPDGSMLAFSHYGQMADLIKISLNEEELEKIKRNESDFKNFKFDLSPDGAEIVYHSNTKKHLWILNIQNGSEILLTSDHPYAYSPAWSPNGKWIAFSALNEANGLISIWKIPATGGNAIEITQAEHGDSFPSWSPDGGKIAYQSRSTKTIVIKILDLESGDSYQITADSTINYNPDWSPDGSKIAFYSTRNDTTAIWIISTSDGTETKLTKKLRFAQNPAWAPDGSKIAYWASSGVWISAVDGEIINQTNIQTRYPAWLPESNGFIAPKIIEYSIIEVFSLIDSSIKPVTQVVDSQFDMQPTWYPDNNTIVFTRIIKLPFPSSLWTVKISDEEALPLLGGSTQLDNARNPAVSPDGNWLLYDNHSNMFLVSLSRGEPVNLSSYLGNNLVEPAWAPDSKSFVCRVNSRNGAEMLKIFYTDSSLAVEQTAIAGNYKNPSWSNSHPTFGSHIAVEYLSGIFIMLPDGSNPELVIASGNQPTWSPDGIKLAYIKSGQMSLLQIFISLPD